MRKINIEVTIEEIAYMLRKSLKDSEQAKTIADVIMLQLTDNNFGLTQLYKAFNGIKPECNFKIGDQVWVKFGNLPTWRMNLSLMEDSDLMNKGHLKVLITNIDLKVEQCLTVTFDYYEKTATTKEIVYKNEYAISVKDVIKEDSFFEEPLPF